MICRLYLPNGGGTETNDAPRFLDECMRNLEKLYNDGKLAGASYWEWAKIYEFSRAGEATKDGILCESLVDFNRNPTLIYDTFKKGIDRIKNGEMEEKNIVVLPMPVTDGEYIPVVLDTIGNEKEWEKMIEKSRIPVPKYCMGRGDRNIIKGPVLPENVEKIGNMPVSLLEKPLVINKKAEIDINSVADKLYFIGNVSMPDAYPVTGELGDLVGRYIVEYKDGSKDIIELKNGEEITTAFMLYGPSRINPVCANAERVLEFSYDYDHEQYIVNCMRVKTDCNKEIDKVIVEVNDDYNLLLYGITKNIKQ